MVVIKKKEYFCCQTGQELDLDVYHSLRCGYRPVPLDAVLCSPSGEAGDAHTTASYWASLLGDVKVYDKHL